MEGLEGRGGGAGEWLRSEYWWVEGGSGARVGGGQLDVALVGVRQSWGRVGEAHVVKEGVDGALGVGEVTGEESGKGGRRKAVGEGEPVAAGSLHTPGVSGDANGDAGLEGPTGRGGSPGQGAKSSRLGNDVR